LKLEDSSREAIELIDIGVNLTHTSFSDDLDEVMARAQGVGVQNMIVTGTSETESRAAQTLAVHYPRWLYATAGVHPHHACDWQNSTADTLQRLAESPQVVALGETGLDFNRNFSPRSDQEKAFETQLELAADLKMPVFMHERDAGERFIQIMTRHRHRLSAAVVHCFTGSKEELAAYLDMDLHIGITGWICDERRGLHLRKLVRDIPLHRLMLETDAPYLLPRNLKPKPKSRRNEPAYLRQVLSMVADCMDLPESAVAAATVQTTRRFFRIG
jgi:TatD DNase family protein